MPAPKKMPIGTANATQIVKTRTDAQLLAKYSKKELQQIFKLVLKYPIDDRKTKQEIVAELRRYGGTYEKTVVTKIVK